MWYKVNKRYIGTQQVRPYRYEYSYDFRNKTSTQVTNDGWEVTRWSVLLNANGLYSIGSMNELFLSNTKLNTKLANSKKLTLKLLWVHQSGTWDFSWYYTTTWKYPSATKLTWVYYLTWSSNEYWYWWTKTTFTQTATWTYWYTYVVDLELKTAILTFTQWSTNTFTHSISDTDIANIRDNNYIRLAVVWSNEAISKIDILVE